MYFKLFYIFWAFFVFLLFPKDAFSWGPGTHIHYAMHALGQLAVLAPAIAKILKDHSKVFLYGTIAADIIFGKKFAGELYHCHHWDVAMPLLKNAKSDRQKAFIYGYLSHLSVDTVAHNYYVPYKIIYSYQTLTLRHTYWEMRFDEKMSPQVWETLKEIGEEDYQDLDDFLESNLKRALFSFKTSKKIFNSLMLISRMKRWRRASSLLAERSTYPLNQAEIDHFRSLAEEVLIEFLQDPEKARVLRADPSGNLKLRYAKEMVRDLRMHTKKGKLTHYKAQKHINLIKESFLNSLYQPGDLPLIEDALN